MKRDTQLKLPGLEVADGPRELARFVARLFVERAREAVKDRGAFTVALAGGSTPLAAYRLIASEYAGDVPWGLCHLFWGDERCVPPSDPESNYGSAKEALLVKVPVRGEKVHRMRGEFPPVEAAARYEAELRGVYATEGLPTDGGVPVLDLVLLGLGTDGHTLSLFPGTPALDETHRLVAENFVGKLDSWRVTMTLPLVNRARSAVFVVSGAEKAEIMREVAADPERYPAGLVRPGGGDPEWYVDREAAGEPG